MTGIAVIPARGGSKRIPRKNLRDLLGRPMMHWPIQAALAIPEVAEVIVSTDDDEIAGLAEGLGASVSGRRPKRLSEDEVPTAPVITYEISKYSERAAQPEFVVVLYPTSVFITSHDLSQMLKRLQDEVHKVQMVMAVCEFPAPIERAWRITDGDLGVPVYPGNRNRQSQEFSKTYYDVGQAYVSSAGAWFAIEDGKPFPTAMHELPVSGAWDINTDDDLLVAEALLGHLLSSGRVERPDGRKPNTSSSERST